MIKNKRIELRVSEATYIDILDRAIDKGMSMALNKLLPDLPDTSLNRLANYYRPFIVKKPS